MKVVRDWLKELTPATMPIGDLSKTVWDRGAEHEDRPKTELGELTEVWSWVSALTGGKGGYYCDSEGRFWRCYDTDPIAYRVYPYFFSRGA